MAGFSSCTIVIDYVPVNLGAEIEPLTLSYFNGVGPQVATISLSGTAVSPALIDISEANPYDFGNMAVNGSRLHTFNLTNNGGFLADTISESGLAAHYRFASGSGFPGFGGTCDTFLGVGDSCEIVVEFIPQFLGTLPAVSYTHLTLPTKRIV